jgi:hypothetical protein
MYQHNYTGMFIIMMVGLVFGTLGLLAARREAAVKRREEASKDRFRKAILLATRKNPWLIRRLAIEFEVAESTVKRWTTGMAVPLPRVRLQIIHWVMRETAEIMK